MNNKEFLSLASKAGTKNTAHTCYMLHWSRYVKGTTFFEYEKSAD